MQRILAECASVGFVECDSGYPRALGWSPWSYDEELLKAVRIYVPEDEQAMTFRRIESLTAYAATCPGDFHVDLVLFRGDRERLQVPSDWTFRD